MIEVKITFEQAVGIFGSIYSFTARMIKYYKDIQVNTQKVAQCFILSATSENINKFLKAENITVQIEDNANDFKYKVIL